MISRPQNTFCYHHQVSYYDTDAMGVVHHGNYLKYFEDARVAWIGESGLGEHHYPNANTHYAVILSQVRHLLPAYFPQKLQTFLQVRRQKLKICIQYVTFAENSEKPLALGLTELVPVDHNQKPTRFPRPALEILEREKWTETWL